MKEFKELVLRPRGKSTDIRKNSYVLGVGKKKKSSRMNEGMNQQIAENVFTPWLKYKNL